MSFEKDSKRETSITSESDTNALGDARAQAQNVVSINAFRTKRALSGDRKSGVQDSFKFASREKVQSTPAKLSNEPAGHDSNETALADRIERLKSSINRINALMEELRSVPDKNLRE